MYVRWVAVAFTLCAWACGEGSEAATAADPDDAGAVDSESLLPCDVVDVLKTRCVECHGRTPAMGAAISLVTTTDFTTERKGRLVGQMVLDRIENSAQPMPPPPAPMLGDAEVVLLRMWIDGGAAADPSGCVVEQPPAPGDGDGTGGKTSIIPDRPDDGGVSWSMFGRDLANTRHDPNEEIITADTVADLAPAWEFDGPYTTGTPVIDGGVVYLTGWDGTVRALDARTGDRVWATTLPNLIDSSVAVTRTRVFVSDDGGSLHALDRESGEVIWSSSLDPHPFAHLWSSPVYIEEEDLIVIGVASSDEDRESGEHYFRGSVVGVDAATGNERWRFYTTTDDDESGAGVGVWASATVDTGRKLVFIGTGNNYEAPAGRYEDSLLAIDYMTGQLSWYRQFTADDVFVIANPVGPDFDIGSTANLIDVGGVDAVGIGSKSGIYFALNRDSGAILWMAELTPGGVLGGVISASAYDGETIYVSSNDYGARQAVTAAIDADTGQLLWKTDPVGGLSFGGVLVAGDVVYFSTWDRDFYALDASTGEQLWSERFPSAVAGGASIADGVLYVPWGYEFTLSEGRVGTGGLVAYAL